MTTSFHLFPRLPTEIRRQVWLMAAAPRIVHIRTTSTLRSKLISDLTTCRQSAYAWSTPPPAVMQVCQESRQNAPYQKAFLTIIPNESDIRYAWVNFHEDMICLADWKVELLACHERDIQRLRFTVPEGDIGELFYEYFFHNSHELLKEFTALRELHIAIKQPCLIWGSTVDGPGYGACPAENVRFLDLTTGLLLTGHEMELAYRWAVQHGGMAPDMDGYDDELHFMLDNESVWEVGQID